jgi:hypothetical protein
MPINKPYYRCYRPNIKENKLEYLRDKRNVENPYDYIRKLEIIYSRLEKIFEFVEPIDTNGDTFSIQLSSLLLDICTTIEANFRSIMNKNGYKKNPNIKRDKDIKSWNIYDYYKVNRSHHLSSYEIKIPFWKGDNNIRNPFENWGKLKDSPTWYQAYNHVKHNMIEKFNEATLNVVVDAFCGLAVIISAQFYDDEILRDPDAYILESYGFPSYRGDFLQTIKTPLLIKYPDDWTDEDKYDFNWNEIKSNPEPFNKVGYKTPNKTYCNNSKLIK